MSKENKNIDIIAKIIIGVLMILFLYVCLITIYQLFIEIKYKNLENITSEVWNDTDFVKSDSIMVYETKIILNN